MQAIVSLSITDPDAACDFTQDGHTWYDDDSPRGRLWTGMSSSDTVSDEDENGFDLGNCMAAEHCDTV